MKYYFLRSHGLICPVAMSSIVFDGCGGVTVTMGNVSKTGPLKDLEIVDEKQLFDIVNVLVNGGIPYR